MIKLIVTDMDGSLLNDDKELSPDFEKVYQQLRDKGIYFAVASGRPSYSLVPQFSFFKHDIFFICDNGAFIDLGSEVIVINPFRKEAILPLIDDARITPGVNLILCGIETAYVESDDLEFMSEVSKYYKKIEHVNDLSKLDISVLKVAMCDLKTWKANSWPVWEKYQSQMTVAGSGDIWVDFMPIGINKGAAIHLLQQKLGISPAETMAFGDYLNDVEMLQEAKYSYAMENAHPDVKKVAKFMAPTNNDHGVIRVINDLVLRDA
jgi:Cof subfamily protein (haloacid dehalogenase superfamily)